MHLSALGLVHLRLRGDSAVVFRYYLLEGDTAMPGYTLGFATHFYFYYILHVLCFKFRCYWFVVCCCTDIFCCLIACIIVANKRKRMNVDNCSL